MNAIEFVKKEGLWVFKYALAQLSFNKDMFLVVYHYECEFVSEVKDNHGDCVFSYREVKQIVDAFELVEYCYGLSDAKELLEEINSEKWVYNLYTNTVISVDYAPSEDMCIRYNVLEKAINLVERCNA